MRARKRFVVIAYDISAARRRNKVVKAIMKYGGRVNLSVFECMLTDSELAKLKTEIGECIDVGSDRVIYYRMCVDCYASITYQPDLKRSGRSSSIVL